MLIAKTTKGFLNFYFGLFALVMVLSGLKVDVLRAAYMVYGGVPSTISGNGNPEIQLTDIEY